MERSTPISATYRLQFNKDFTFRDATGLLDYFPSWASPHLRLADMAQPAGQHTWI